MNSLSKVARAVVDSLKESNITDPADKEACIQMAAVLTGLPLSELREKCDEYIRTDAGIRE